MVSDLLAPKPDYQTTPVSVLPASGPAPAGLVIKTSKPASHSTTIWGGCIGTAYFFGDALLPVAQSLLSADHPPANLWTVAQKAGLALIFAYFVYRRKTDNQVIQ